ncbi:hypothetical protein [Flammeovirga sp. EKP202]|uniref:hypothetical protein n=1 Tax=Flammeovirga sp. EKP202 TaxID=2770592 RepID=UPI00165EF69F|nr:hypothetical protein [Flammeovirga sp. EKP202]MBD0399977.1 hypothetical protein [Flammeovirga sp. EKP202]
MLSDSGIRVCKINRNLLISNYHNYAIGSFYIASVKPIGVTCDDTLAKSPDFEMNENVAFIFEVGRQ